MAASSSITPGTTRLGEVIETSTLGYWAESDELHKLPSLGELVRVNIDDGDICYGVVSFGQTGGIDPGRRAVRRGDSEHSDAEIYARHPELEHVLRTIFRVAAVGYERDGRIRHTVPPLPVPLHYSVHACSEREVERFCRVPHYFASLLAFRGEINAEDLLAGHLRWVDETFDDEHQWLESATRRLARLMKRDYDRLVNLLEAVDPYAG